MKSFLIILLFFLCPCLFGQNGNTNTSRWHNNGNPESSYYKSARNNRLQYFLSNDNDNIYIDLKIIDTDSQGLILKEGLIIWIDMDGKSQKKMGIRYPVGSQNQVSFNRTGKSDIVQNHGDDGSSILKLANTIELIGFISEQERRFSSDNPDNFRGSVRYDEESTLHYIMVMPLAKLPVRNSKEGNGAMPFALGIEYGFPPEVDKPVAKMSAGRNSVVQLTKAGSEIYWIKNVKLASSK
jgi:hypothetical protein